MPEIEGLTLLGQAQTDYPQAYSPQVLERFRQPLSRARLRGGTRLS